MSTQERLITAPKIIPLKYIIHTRYCGESSIKSRDLVFFMWFNKIIEGYVLSRSKEGIKTISFNHNKKNTGTN